MINTPNWPGAVRPGELVTAEAKLENAPTLLRIERAA